LIVGSSLWNVKPEPMKPAKPEIGASLAANPVTGYFEDRRKELLTLLGFEEDRGSLVRPNGDDYSLASVFAQLHKLSEEDVLRLLALAMAESLAVGSATAELAGAVTGATLNDWRPDDIFFDLLNGKDVVNAMLSDAGSPAIAEGNKGETAKVQKGIIKDIMLGRNGREQNADWLPAYFRFPPMAHTPRGGIAIVDRWHSVAELLHPAM
jgi:ParB family transcriptional regulator, chromosome partitioning protein